MSGKAARATKRWAKKARAAERSRLPDLAKLKRWLSKGGGSIEALCIAFDIEPGTARRAMSELRDQGIAVRNDHGHLHIGQPPPPADDGRFSLKVGADRWLRVGLVADSHIGSRHARVEVLDELYDWFEDEGIETVLHAGNWIEGIARFNLGDLEPGCHEWSGQLARFLERYPKRPGIQTRLISGDDHEGWLQQRDQIDVGAWMESAARASGRDDLVSLGYVEAFIRLEQKGVADPARLLIQHPGGGSSYALSYAPQKLVESFQPGEKPAILALGHWHKSGYFQVRGVHTILVPSTKDQDTFHRKHKLDSHIGGVILEVRMDARGAVLECIPRFRRYYDRSYYNNQFEIGAGKRRTKA